MHQNVYRMNCANVLCMKLSKTWFFLHLNRPKLKNYLLHFVMKDPVGKLYCNISLSVQRKCLYYRKISYEYAILKLLMKSSLRISMTIVSGKWQELKIPPLSTIHVTLPQYIVNIWMWYNQVGVRWGFLSKL